MTIVFKVSDNIKQKVIEHYKDLRKEKTPPYAIFQAVEADTVVTLYESGKLMFQGVSADIDANMWIDLEKHLNNRDIIIDTTKKDKKETKKEFFNISTIGSDEVGTGDFFGPIVVTASYVPKNKFNFLFDLGVKDSKKITDDKIKKIAPLLIKEIDHCTIILDNKTYNANYDNNVNMNKIKALLHNKALLSLIKQFNPQYEKIVIDQFVYPQKYYEHLNQVKEKVTNITFTTKAEDKCLSVAVSSIISRYIFLKKMQELSEQLKIQLPKGAGPVVDEIGVKIINQYGYAKLTEIAKMNFKNAQKIQSNSN